VRSAAATGNEPPHEIEDSRPHDHDDDDVVDDPRAHSFPCPIYV